MRAILLTLLVVASLSVALPARAQITIDAHAPDFSKPELVSGAAGPNRTLYEFADRAAVVLFLLGND